MAQGMANAEIADALVVSRSTVNAYVAHMLAKLEVRDRVQAAVLADEAGVAKPGSGPDDHTWPRRHAVLASVEPFPRISLPQV
jgi:transposase